MVGIYKITNLINGKVYIGQSIDIERRWKEHKKDAFWKDGTCYDYPLYRAIRKYGIDSFSFEVLAECDKKELNEKENLYIAKYDSYKNGYNQTEGGRENSSSCKLTSAEVDKIIERLKTTLDTTPVIGNDFCVSYSTIRDINVGKTYRRESENYPIRPPLNTLCKTDNGYKHKQVGFYCFICGAPVYEKGNMCKSCSNLHNSKVKDKPSPLDLAKMIKEDGFEKVGKAFGVSGKAIVKWCEQYHIPKRKKDLVLWYNEQVGIENAAITDIKKKEMNKPVAQIDILSGKVIATFKNANYAAKAMGRETGQHIREVCYGRRNSAYGFNWAYADNT